MKITELQTILQNTLKEYGDIEVEIYDHEYREYETLNSSEIEIWFESNKTVLGLRG